MSPIVLSHLPDKAKLDALFVADVLDPSLFPFSSTRIDWHFGGTSWGGPNTGRSSSFPTFLTRAHVEDGGLIVIWDLPMIAVSVSQLEWVTKAGPTSRSNVFSLPRKPIESSNTYFSNCFPHTPQPSTTLQSDLAHRQAEFWPLADLWASKI